jgi:hypothetical protein
MDGSGSPVNPTDIITLGDLSNFVTTNTVQNITDYKTFSGGILIDDSLAFIKRLSNITSSSQGIVYFKTDNTFNVSVGTGVGAHNATFDGIDAFTVARTFTLPDANGTFALEGDFVDLTTSQIIAGEKVFTDPTSIESLVFTQNGDSFLVPFGVQHNNTLGFTFQDNTLGGGQCFSFLGQGLTANRVQTIQDKDGTIAHLDDIPVSGEYEESTWVITATDSGGGATYSGTFHANFVRVGKLVTYVINLSSLNTTGVPSGVFTLSLPYSVAGNASAAASVARVFASNKNFYSIMGIANASTSTLTFDIQAGLDSYTEPFDAVTWTGGRIYVSGSYIATGV